MQRDGIDIYTHTKIRHCHDRILMFKVKNKN